jgi:hypothetical protein
VNITETYTAHSGTKACEVCTLGNSHFVAISQLLAAAPKSATKYLLEAWIVAPAGTVLQPVDLWMDFGGDGEGVSSVNPTSQWQHVSSLVTTNPVDAGGNLTAFVGNFGAGTSTFPAGLCLIVDDVALTVVP